jgi:hypothetical protein
LNSVSVSEKRDIKARCSSCYWGGWASECRHISFDLLACPKCSELSVIKYEEVVTERRTTKCAVSNDYKEPEESGLKNGKVEKRWWQK